MKKSEKFRRQYTFQFSILTFLLVFLGLTLIGFYQLKQKQSLLLELAELQPLLLNAESSINRYSSSWTNNNDYLTKGIHPDYTHYTEALKKAKQKATALESYKDEDINHIIQPTLDSLSANLEKGHKINKINRQRGFNDYGIEGEMRDKIHRIEQLQGLDQAKLLTLRRNEKDYFLRHSPKYITKFEDNFILFKESIEASSLSDSNKTFALNNAAIYKMLFLDIADLEIKVGYDINTGLRGKLSDNFQAIHLLNNNARKLLLFKIDRLVLLISLSTIIGAIGLPLAIFIYFYYLRRYVFDTLDIIEDINLNLSQGKLKNFVVPKKTPPVLVRFSNHNGEYDTKD